MSFERISLSHFALLWRLHGSVNCSLAPVHPLSCCKLMIQDGSVVSPEQSCICMYKTEESILIKHMLLWIFLKEILVLMQMGCGLFSFQRTIKIQLKKQRDYINLLFLWRFFQDFSSSCLWRIFLLWIQVSTLWHGSQQQLADWSFRPVNDHEEFLLCGRFWDVRVLYLIGTKYQSQLRM